MLVEPRQRRSSAAELLIPRGAAVSCPKCGTALSSVASASSYPACSRCGLLVARWPGYAPENESQVFVDAWQACEQDWQDSRRHERVLEVALAQGELSQLARRYRLRAENPMAQTQLARLIQCAEAAARAQAEPTLTRRTTLLLRVFAHLAAFALFGAVAWLVAHAARSIHVGLPGSG